MHTSHGFITGWVCIATLAITLGIFIFIAWITRNLLAKQKTTETSKLPVKEH